MTSPPETPEEIGAWATARLPVEGLRCLSCVLRLESAIEDLPHVLSASVDLAKAVATILYRPGAVTREDLVRAVAEAGYRVGPPASEGDDGP